MDQKTRVSVVMCTYNGEKYIREQIDSIIAQTYPIYELIIQDDGSTDATISIIEEYMYINNTSTKIYLYKNEKRLGYNKNFMTAILKATGDYIACCDQDDIWVENKISRLLFAIGDSSLIFHNSVLVTEKLQLIGKLHVKKYPRKIDPIIAIAYPIAYGHQILFKSEVRDLLKTFCAYDISYDYLIYSLSAIFSGVTFLDENLVYWRRYETATTFNPKSNSYSPLGGYFKALRALFCRVNRSRASKYYFLLLKIIGLKGEKKSYIKAMSTGKLIDIFFACILSCRHRKNLYLNMAGRKIFIRSLFLPLFFVRDHGRYIINN